MSSRTVQSTPQVSFNCSTFFSKGKRKAGSSAIKLKRKKSEAKTSNSAESGDSNGFILVDSYAATESTTQVIDLTGSSDQSKPPSNKSRSQRQKLKEKRRQKRAQAGKAKAGKALDSPSRGKHKGSVVLGTKVLLRRLLGQACTSSFSIPVGRSVSITFMFLGIARFRGAG